MIVVARPGEYALVDGVLVAIEAAALGIVRLSIPDEAGPVLLPAKLCEHCGYPLSAEKPGAHAVDDRPAPF